MVTILIVEEDGTAAHAALGYVHWDATGAGARGILIDSSYGNIVDGNQISGAGKGTGVTGYTNTVCSNNIVVSFATGYLSCITSLNNIDQF